MRLLRVPTVLVLALLWLMPLTRTATAAEEILYFLSDIKVEKDGTLIVTETITVRAEGGQILHGIYRDIPRLLRKPDGSVGMADFKVLKVLRDDKPEPWFVKSPRSGVVRVYMGNARERISQGMHTYKLSYRITRQIRYFEDHDELFWNVTGHEWAFAIHWAQVSVQLPEGANILRYALYTGRPGSRARDAQVVRNEENRFVAKTTRMLKPGEGFSVVVAFPKGIVAQPTMLRQAWWRLRDMAGPAWFIAGTVITIAWLFIAWWRHGRDPEPGVIVPNWQPPHGVSPAVASHIMRATKISLGQDYRPFIAALISLASKGYIRIDHSPDETVLHKGTLANPRLYNLIRPANSNLAPEEKLLMREMFDHLNFFHINKNNGERLREILQNFNSMIKSEVDYVHLVRNRWQYYIGLALAVYTFVGLGVLAFMGDPSASDAFLILTLIFITLAAIGVILWDFKRGKVQIRRIFRIFVILGFMGILLYNMFSYSPTETSGVFLSPAWRYAVLFTLVVLSGALVIFWYLMPRPTEKGRQILDKLEGLRMFIETAERERLKRASVMSGKLFEQLLPWAVALGVEESWTRAFRQWLQEDAPVTAKDYQPFWYSGNFLNEITETNETGGLVSGLHSSISSAMPVADSTSSGFGGGVGGGGGGGGGGGW